VRLRVTILGCGGSGGVPQIGGVDGRGWWGECDPANPLNRRTRSAIVIEGPDGRRLLVDAGADLRAQLLAACIGRVEAVLITHSHADHIMGLDELRPINREIGAALPLLATEETLAELRRRFDYIFRPPVPPAFYRPAVTPVVVRPGERVTAAGLPMQLFSQDHAVMETLGLRIGRFAYSTDVLVLPERSLAALEGVDTWVVGCFQRAPHKVHAHVGQALAWVERLRPRRTVLTHMSPDLDHAWLRANLPPGVEPAHDGMVLEIGEAE
jgi:phosphoribosyl 1,2-cyclic phosphate phosphodiesterase